MDNLTMQSRISQISGIGQLPVRPELPIVPPGMIGPAMGAGGVEAAGGTQGADFSKAMTDAIEKVNGTMLDADAQVTALATGQSSNMHGTLIAMQKADVSFRMMLEVRNKVLKAYEEVMRLQA
jgi:flagellar hook-basal body complex protein FliE